jgi:hypothetical protein
MKNSGKHSAVRGSVKGLPLCFALLANIAFMAAPDKIIATKYISDNPANRVAFQRPLCPYPQIAQPESTGNSGGGTPQI